MNNSYLSLLIIFFENQGEFPSKSDQILDEYKPSERFQGNNRFS